MSRLTRSLFDANVALGRGMRRVSRALGVARPLRVVPYRGYGTAQRATILARVVVDRGAPPLVDEASLLASGWASMRRFWTAEIAGADVRIVWEDSSAETTTDDGGFVDARMPVPASLPPGMHGVRIEVLAPEEGLALPSAIASVCIAGPDARFGVISDIDDTVILTDVVRRVRRAKALFFPEASNRQPFEGVAEAYRALHGGASGEAYNPFVYVSSSPWNLYDHLEEFLDRHGLPPGALLLRDWGLRRDGFAPDGRHEHKIEKVTTVLDDFPELPFLLIGDSGQRDAEHYLEAASRRPGRVAAIYIRRVLERPGRGEELDALAGRARDEGVDLLSFEDSAGLIDDVRSRGLL